MRFNEWRSLSDDEKKNIHWRRRPHIRVATIFSVLFFVGFMVIILGMLHNRRVYVNRKPTSQEAYAMAKEFVKLKLKMPQTARFPGNSSKTDIDTSVNNYRLQGTVKAEDVNGKAFQSAWTVGMTYTGGTWDEMRSWKLAKIELKPFK